MPGADAVTVTDSHIALRLPRASWAGPVLVGGLLAATFGVALASDPLDAVLLLGLVPLALACPTATLGVVLFVTVLVPFDTQNRYSLGGGAGVPGLLAVDLLLLLGLCRIAFLVWRRRLRVTRPLAVAALFLVGIFGAAVHGLATGAAASDVGTEARCLVFGIGAFLLAWPLLLEQATRVRLYRTLLALGLALGLWGVAQVVLKVPYTSSGDVGVRPGIDQIAAIGGGQLQGGLYAFPVAVALSFAALLSGAIKSGAVRALTVTIFGLNCVCVLLTYERSIWAAAIIGCIAAALRSGRAAWPATRRWLAVGLAVVAVYAAGSPGAVSTAINRIESSFSYQNQNSFQARKVESEAVLKAIRHEPLTGSGFGATVTWGKRNIFATSTTNFSHEGYLWLAWKVGLPLALALVGCLLFTALRRMRPTADPPFRALRVGSHAALLASLAVCVTFPEFNALGITAALGVITAACSVPTISAAGSSPQAPRRRSGLVLTP
ncbi:MAG: O-antigen ligase [Mycobacterium sp.]|nr:O-antigen ligase [Mycobacterium sp.]